ncbi:MAG: DUF2087 domain-containing protein [bacterium]
MERTSIEKILMERFAITEEDYTEYIGRFLDRQGRLRSLPAKQKQQTVVYMHLASLFVCDRIYAEAEVNRILATVAADFASYRRALIDNGLMSRSKDGREYFRNR